MELKIKIKDKEYSVKVFEEGNAVKVIVNNNEYIFNSQNKEESLIQSSSKSIKKEIKVYSTANGMLNITWAKHSENFQDVHFQFINDVIDLSKARLLDHLADTSGILSDTNLEITINAEALKDKASALRDKVIEKWNAIPDMIYLHVV